MQEIVAPFKRGDPISSVLWTSKSLMNLSKELKRDGYGIRHRTVRNMLLDIGCSFKSNKKPK